MNTGHLIVHRFSELLAKGEVGQAAVYLDDDVVLQSWHGVMEGKADVINFLDDNRRFMHHHRVFSPWRLVHRTIDTDTLVQNGESEYDADGYAIYERVGHMDTRAKFSMKTESVRESMALKNDYIVLIVLSKRGL